MAKERTEKSGLAVGLNKGHVSLSLHLAIEMERMKSRIGIFSLHGGNAAERIFSLSLDLVVGAKLQFCHLDALNLPVSGGKLTLFSPIHRKSPQSPRSLASAAPRATSASAPPS